MMLGSELARLPFLGGHMRVIPSFLLFMALSIGAPAFAQSSAPTATSRAAEPAFAEGDLERLIDSLASDDPAARTSAAKAIAALGEDAIPAFGNQLAAHRKIPTSAVASAVRAAREASSAKAGSDLDLGDALLETKSDGPGYRAAVSTAIVLRALAHSGTTPAMRHLVRVATDHRGTFRTEVARHVKALGDKAVPALIETRKDSPPELRHWAYSQLESMGKRIPGDAVQTKDNQVLVDVLRAFANVHDMDALPVLLSFVNSDRIQVRNAARESLMAFGQDAVWKLREAYANVTSNAAPEGWPSAQIAKELFAAYDRIRLREVYDLLDDGLAMEKAGKVDEAVAAFDKVLARHPMLDRRGEVVPAYVAHATALEDSDPIKALLVFRKAARLWPEGPRTPHIEAEIAYLEGRELLARGVTDLEPFQRAIALDPTHERARAELRRFETNVEERRDRLNVYAGVAASVVVAVCGLLLFGGARRPRRTLRA
ncbi:MAG TPA: tetratricopeptide repeat protein [Labilithrix sp.]|nr:tetratricopeptide repeat protein [Labilithrix sp.]